MNICVDIANDLFKYENYEIVEDEFVIFNNCELLVDFKTYDGKLKAGTDYSSIIIDVTAMAVKIINEYVENEDDWENCWHLFLADDIWENFDYCGLIGIED